MSEDENLLPDVLKNLEIVPVTAISQKVPDDSLNVSENPFFYGHETTVNGQQAVSEACDPIKLFGPRCECSKRLVTRSNSNSSSNSTVNNNNNSTIEHTILNQTQFKHRHISSKFLLRDPILKVLQRCMHYNHVKHKTGAPGSNQLCTEDTIDDLSDYPTLDALKIDENGATDLRQNARQPEPKYLDFKELVRECDVISSSATPGCSSHFVGSAIAHRKHAKQFTTIQSFDLRKSSKDSKKSKKSKDDEPELNSRQETGGTSSSCSQQARINAAAAASSTTAATTTCDVTIDELASYFETFVHIPKKMSSMAEMMYI